MCVQVPVRPLEIKKSIIKWIGFLILGRLTSLSYEDAISTLKVDFSYDILGNRKQMAEF